MYLILEDENIDREERAGENNHLASQKNEYFLLLVPLIPGIQLLNKEYHRFWMLKMKAIRFTAYLLYIINMYTRFFPTIKTNI